jgi:flagellin
MSVVINTNTPASLASYNLSTTNANLQRSLNRLSSGSRINSSFDDAGGLAVSMKLSASIRRTDATLANVQNSLAFLQTQDGVLKNADKILNRMSELATLSQDVSKTTTDTALYNTELTVLKQQLTLSLSERVNGISVFGTGAVGGMTVVTSHDGNQTVGITASNLADINTRIGAYDITSQSGARAAVTNIQNEILHTNSKVGYLVMDLDELNMKVSMAKTIEQAELSDLEQATLASTSSVVEETTSFIAPVKSTVIYGSGVGSSAFGMPASSNNSTLLPPSSSASFLPTEDEHHSS